MGGPARASRMPPLERSIAAMRAAKVRWARTSPEERSAWARYMLQHQRRFWDGRTLPRKPVRERTPVPVGAPQLFELTSVGMSARACRLSQPPKGAIPVVVIPAPVREPSMPSCGPLPHLRADHRRASVRALCDPERGHLPIPHTACRLLANRRVH
jgi:hypothetical protein